MERSLTRPYKVPRVGGFELSIGRLREAQPLLRTLTPTFVHCDRRHELEIMSVEPEDPQQPGKAGKIAVDDLLQVRHPSATPILEALGRKQAHANEDVDWRHNLACREYLAHSARDSRVERIVTIRAEAQFWL